MLENSAIALVWIDEGQIIHYRKDLPPIAQFRPAYCQAIYPTAKALFQEGQHRQALTLYQDMHRLHCHQPTDYFLDAAECFLALEQSEDAQRMANYLLTEYEPALNSAVLERAGDILLKAHDEANARKAYEKALVKLREGF